MQKFNIDSFFQGLEGLEGVTLDKDQGMKYDGGKLLAAILFQDFPNALEGVLDVATFGAKKYARASWASVPNALQRYEDAFFRHLIALYKGEELDPESGLPHIDHITWNALTISQLRKKNV